MIAFISGLSLFLVFYAYFGYPLILSFLIRKRVVERPAGEQPQSMSVIIAARNEERVIAKKIEETLALTAPTLSQPLQIIVASDCSDDETDKIVARYPSVLLVRSPERQGKERAQKLAIESATGEILVFTDAKVSLEIDALQRFAAHFVDRTVGAVSSVDRVRSDTGQGSGEGMYVRYEMWLRELETKFDTLVGLSGSCFAVRRELTKNMRVDIPSDFSLLIETVRNGLRGISAEDVTCTYTAVKSEEEEFQRKVRTVLRGIATLLSAKELMDFRRYKTFSWQLISHKLCRWLVPWFLIVSLLGSIAEADQSFLFLLVAFGLLTFFGAAFVAFLYPRLREKRIYKIPLFFTVTNAAILVAWIKYWQGERAVVWQPSSKV